ncbi:MAG: hypothetical protein A2W00_12485 [Candidatus Eisenbacteria bacterium RBG_16_71_46]|nr:MAG: hypothetical protein A2W00_12485 [Candidatus Eisenbacteria bacterium RBG_16_71_46]
MPTPKPNVVRNGLALAVFAMGLIDLGSALLSRPPERLLAIRHMLPTDVLDTSRTFTLLAGALLVVTAWGLRRGKRRAYVAALFLCALSVPMNVLKALDLEEATVAAGLMFLLGVSADVFRVKSRELSLRNLRSQAAVALLALLIYAIGGSWLLMQSYGTRPSLRAAAETAAYRLFGVGEATIETDQPLLHHEQRIVTWFLRSLPVLSLSLVIGVSLAALRPATHRRRHHHEAERAAELLEQYGDSTVAAFALDQENDYFFSSNRRAVIAYRFESDTLLTIGDPIGPPEEIPHLLESFAEFCRGHDWQFAFFQARPEYLPLYRERGWRALHIGEDPVLWTDRFSLEGSAIGEVRRAVHKLQGQGLETRMFFPGANPFDAAADTEGLLPQLREISAQWVHGRSGGERGFCMGRFDPHRLGESWLAVAWSPGTRRVEGFVTWVPIWARRGWALDLIRRRDDAVPGTMEFLVAKSVEAARARGDALVSLSLSALASVEAPAGAEEPAGAAPLGGEAPVPPESRTAAADATPRTPARPAAPAPPTAGAAASEPDRAREFLMYHLARFYDFKNLFRWKKKFNPAFEDRFLVYQDPLALPRVALALARAQSPGGLRSYLRRAG